MKVHIRYDHTTCRIEAGVLSTDCQNALSEALSYEVPGAEHMMRAAKYGKRFGAQWDGKKRLYHKGHRTFGTGLLGKVIDVLGDHGYDVDVSNKNFAAAEQDYIIYPEPGPEWALRDEYQTQAVKDIIAWERGMIKVATGGGKTVIAGHVIGRLRCSAVFLVHTKDLLYQAYDTFVSMYGVDMVGVVGDGKIDTTRAITVCTIQTAARALGVDYEKDNNAEGEDTWQDEATTGHDDAIARMLQRAGCVMVDECHRVAAPTATAVVGAVRHAPYRYGFSASPWRDDGADIALEAVFGDVIVDINASTLIDMGFLVTPYISIKPVPPAAFPKGTKYATIYEEYIVNNEVRNAMVVADAVKKIQRGIQTMVLVRQIKHGALIQKHMNELLDGGVPFLSGKDDSDTRNSTIRSLRDQTTKALVATTIADEGLDIKPLAGLVLAGGGKSSTRALQRVGRVLRPFGGKGKAYVTDFEDKAKFLIDHSAARQRIYESEPRFILTD